MRNETKVFVGGLLTVICFVVIMGFPHWYIFIPASLAACFGLLVFGLGAKDLATGRVKYLFGREQKLCLPEGETYIYRGQHTLANMGLHLIFLEDMNGEYLYAQEIPEPLKVEHEDESLAIVKNGRITFKHEPKVSMLVSVAPS